METFAVRLPRYVVEDGELPEPVVGCELTTGLGLVCGSNRRASERARRDLVGVLRRASHLFAVDGPITAVLLTDVAPANDLVDTFVTFRGEMVVEPYLWGSGGESLLRAALPRGWWRWRVEAIEPIPSSRVGDQLLHLALD